MSNNSIITACVDPSPKDVYRAARAYLDAGLSFIPISADGTKMPAFELLPAVLCGRRQEHRRSWSIFRERQPTQDELREWFRHSQGDREYGLAILGGAISGNLEILDLDNYDVAKAFRQKLEKRKPGLFRRLVKVQTPRPGLHCYYRCREIAGNQKLAKVSDPDSPKPKAKTIIETKGEGGYCLAPPSPRDCHPRRECYQFLGAKDLTQVPTITPGERHVILETARSFDTWQARVLQDRRQRRRRTSAGPRGQRSGDDFNARGDWAEILVPHGWTFVGDDGGETDYWCRPGKSEGVSATTNHGGCDLLYVFSTNADPFESEECYTKFHAYALLECDGDFSEAASELCSQGYGKKCRRSKAPKPKPPYVGRSLRSRRR